MKTSARNAIRFITFMSTKTAFAPKEGLIKPNID